MTAKIKLTLLITWLIVLAVFAIICAIASLNGYPWHAYTCGLAILAFLVTTWQNMQLLETKF